MRGLGVVAVVAGERNRGEDPDDDDQDRHLAAGEDLEDDVAGVSVS